MPCPDSGDNKRRIAPCVCWRLFRLHGTGEFAVCLLDSSRGLAALLLRWNVLLILLLRTAPVDKRSFFTGAAQTVTEVKVIVFNHVRARRVNIFQMALSGTSLLDSRLKPPLLLRFGITLCSWILLLRAWSSTEKQNFQQQLEGRNANVQDLLSCNREFFADIKFLLVGPFGHFFKRHYAWHLFWISCFSVVVAGLWQHSV